MELTQQLAQFLVAAESIKIYSRFAVVTIADEDGKEVGTLDKLPLIFHSNLCCFKAPCLAIRPTPRTTGVQQTEVLSICCISFHRKTIAACRADPQRAPLCRGLHRVTSCRPGQAGGTCPGPPPALGYCPLCMEFSHTILHTYHGLDSEHKTVVPPISPIAFRSNAL